MNFFVLKHAWFCLLSQHCFLISFYFIFVAHFSQCCLSYCCTFIHVLFADAFPLLGEAKPGGFPLFWGKVQIVSRTLSGLFLVGTVDEKEEKGQIRENPEESRDKSGKSRKNRESPKKDKKGQKGRTSPDGETPRLAALATIFALLFSQNFSHVPLTHDSNIFVQSCVLPKGFHSLQLQHCI